MEIIFERYEILEEIGNGSNGRVFKVRDIRLDRIFAMKEEKVKGIAKGEADYLKQLNHSGIPHIYDYYEKDDVVYIIMDLAEGITLTEYVSKQGALSEREANDIIFQLLDIIGYLHNFSPAVIYRDLKPDNIMIDSKGEIMLIDYGALFRQNYVNYDMGDNIGTRGYSAPELWQGNIAEQTADIYSIGAVWIVMLTGRLVEAGTYLKGEILKIGRQVSDCTKKCIGKCVMMEVKNRYGSIEEIRRDMCSSDNSSIIKSVLLWVRKITVGGLYLLSFLSVAVPVFSGSEYTLKNILITASLFVLAYILSWVFFANRVRKNEVRIIKEIRITDKKFLGLYSVILVLIGAFGVMILSFGINKGKVYALGEREKLWVNVLDGRQRNLLIKEETVYEVDENLTFEIPMDVIPDDELYISIVARDSEGNLYESRSFGVVRKKNTPLS